MEWSEVSITTSSEAVEAISAFILEMGFCVSIHDPKDMLNTKNTVDTIFDKDFILGDDVVINVYFSEDVNVAEKIDEIKCFLKSISQYINIGKGEVSVANVKGEDWENGWKKYYKPIKVGQKIVIKPSWEDYETYNNGDIVVEIDPGAAFGTGTHETTRLCIKYLEKFVKKNDVVLDIGCGSGILGICASKLGASKVIGADIDILAVKASKDNIALNNLNNVEIRQGNLFDVFNELADVIVANIIADVIISIVPSIIQHLKSNGIFICSGIIKDRAEDVRKSLIQNGYKIIEETQDGEWVAIAANKG